MQLDGIAETDRIVWTHQHLHGEIWLLKWVGFDGWDIWWIGIDFLLKGTPLAPQSEVLLAMWLGSRMLDRLLAVLQVN